jgi:hypothetical protein
MANRETDYSKIRNKRGLEYYSVADIGGRINRISAEKIA